MDWIIDTSSTTVPEPPRLLTDEARPSRPAQQSTPTTGAMSAGLVLFLVLFTIGLGMLIGGAVWFLREWDKHTQLQASSAGARAVVTDWHVKTYSESDKTYYITYRFEARLPNGELKQFTKKEAVDDETYNALERGKRVSVIYATSDPSISALASNYRDPQRRFTLPLTLVGFGLLLSLVLGVAVVAVNKGWRQALELDMKGRFAQGTIINRWTVSDDGDHIYYVAYQFEVQQHNGDSQQFAATQFVERKEYERLGIGSKVQVRFLPQDPNISRRN